MLLWNSHDAPFDMPRYTVLLDRTELALDLKNWA